MKKAPKLLIIDDDKAFTESNVELLEAFGYNVKAEHSGRAGLEAARKDPPDVIILDVMMSTDTEGFEVAREISEDPALAKASVLLVTGVSRSLQLPGILAPDISWLPVRKVLEKPIQPDRLLAEIEQVLGVKG